MGVANHTLFQSISSSAEWCRQGDMVSATENFQSDIFIYETPNSQCLTIQLNCEEESNPLGRADKGRYRPGPHNKLAKLGDAMGLTNGGKIYSCICILQHS